VYERMYPATKFGAFKGNQHSGNLVSDIMSFTRSVAEQRDLSKRQIERLVAAGQALDRETIRQLRAAPKRVTLADLQTLAKCGVEADRRAICAALAAGAAKSAKAALTARHAKPGDVARQPADLDARRLADAFARASQEGRKRFARDHLEALQKLIAQVSK